MGSNPTLSAINMLDSAPASPATLRDNKLPLAPLASLVLAHPCAKYMFEVASSFSAILSLDSAPASPASLLAKKKPRVCGAFRLSGGAEENRTPDLRIANATLSQLSYRP